MVTSTASAAFRDELTSLGGIHRRHYQEGSATIHVAESFGLKHAFVEADGWIPEHHTAVPVAMRSAAMLAPRCGALEWSAGHDVALAQWLQAHPAWAALRARLGWLARRSPGATPFELDWLLQLRPVGSATWVVLCAANESHGGAGLATLLKIVELMLATIPRCNSADSRAATSVAQPLLLPTPFARLAERALGLEPRLVPPQQLRSA